MDRVAAVVPDEQPLEVMQPGEGALDDPADAAEPGAVLGLAAGDFGAGDRDRLSPVRAVAGTPGDNADDDHERKPDAQQD